MEMARKRTEWREASGPGHQHGRVHDRRGGRDRHRRPPLLGLGGVQCSPAMRGSVTSFLAIFIGAGILVSYWLVC